MSYTTDYRKRALGYRAEGHTLKETCAVFKISVSTLRSWQELDRLNGTPAKRELHRGFKKIDPEKLKEYIRNHPDAYCKEIAEVFGCTDTAIRKALDRLGITRKKRRNAI